MPKGFSPAKTTPGKREWNGSQELQIHKSEENKRSYGDVDEIDCISIVCNTFPVLDYACFGVDLLSLFKDI